jgi:CPA1 family monovalent cation:H+ antiporter
MMVFLLNGLVFVLIGLQLPRILHTLSGPLSETASLPRRADKLRRHCCAHRLGFYIDLPAAFHERFLAQKRPVSGVAENVAIVAWTGMRGVVSLAAALAVPLTLSDGSPFPGRDYILFITFCVILATLVLQGSEFARADSPAWSGR